MTNQDVIDMVSLGLPDDVIIEKIRAVGGTDFDTSVPGLRVLKAGGVSGSVILVMINPSLGSNPVLTPDGSKAIVSQETPSPKETQAAPAVAQLGASFDGNPLIRHDGITLSHVVMGGPADQAGMMAGDVVLAIDGHYLYTGQEMNDEILRHKTGTKIAVRYRRHTMTNEASVVMGATQQPAPVPTPTAPAPTHPVAAMAGFGQEQDKTSESTPPSDGVFYKNATGWQQLEPITTAGENIHVNVFTMHGAGKQVYNGAEAPTQLSDRRPVLYIKLTQAEAMTAEYGGPNAARNAVIVILSKKKDHRELQSVKSGLSGVKSGIDKKLLPDVTLSSIKQPMSGALQERLVTLGNMTGKTATEIIAVLGTPTSRSSIRNDQVLLQWLATGYHIAILFDAEERFVRITHQADNLSRAQYNLTVTVTPNQDLAPGEYLLTWDSMGNTGYDFGVK
jgi:hypothetical protein